jgi:hypothetical protein
MPTFTLNDKDNALIWKVKLPGSYSISLHRFKVIIDSNLLIVKEVNIQKKGRDESHN